MAVVVDLGIGNVGSVANMIRRCGSQLRVERQPNHQDLGTHYILTGVGSFDYGMSALKDLGWIDFLRRHIESRSISLLGICLGMQMLGRGSEEGSLPGLGLIPGFTRKLVAPPEAAIRLPHMGWNSLNVLRENSLTTSESTDDRFYFVHSYHLTEVDSTFVVAVTEHGQVFNSVVSRQNVHGVQFHPEKSHKFGMGLMSRFLGL